jgi:hypothetical protein
VGKRESGLVVRHAAAVRTQLQPMLVGVCSAQETPGILVEPRQHNLQQTHLTGDELYCLPDVGATAEMPDQGKSRDLGDGDDGNHQQHRPPRQR